MEIKVHPVTGVAAEIIKSLTEQDAENLEEALTEGILDDENSDLCAACLETWKAVQAGELVPERDALALAVIILQMTVASYQEEEEEGEECDTSEDWKN